MARLSFCWLLAAAFAMQAGAQSRVVLVSLDGMGYERFTEDPVAEELTALKKIAREGVVAQGAVPHMPSTTANTHAALFTGAYGAVNGISGNSVPRTPRAEHEFREWAIGFRAESLKAEPIWAAAARQGVSAVAYQATQAFPFLPINTAPGSKTPPVVVNGYQTREVAPYQVVRGADVKAEDCAVFVPLVSGAVRCFSWSAKPYTLYGAATAKDLFVAADPKGGRVRVESQALETELPRRRALARYFSAGLTVAPGLVTHFRLTGLTADASDFLLLQTPLQELGYYNGGADADAQRDQMLAETGAFVGNGPGRLLGRGGLGELSYKGGDGSAERLYLEAVEFVIRQNTRQAEWLAKRFSPRLFIGYLNYPDEVDHAWYGMVHESTPGVSKALRDRYTFYRRWAYVALNRAVDAFADLAAKDGTVLFTSDHGMAPVWKHVNIDRLLREAGQADRVTHVYNFLVVNTTDWKKGTVPPEQRKAVVAEAQSVLARVKDPETGQPVFTEFFRPETDGERFGIGGPHSGDLYFEYARGYSFTRDKDAPVVGRAEAPLGNHGFLPTRADMLAILIGRGPRLPKGGTWPRVKVIDVAPLVAQLLGIEAPAQATGASPLR
ncbi:MAG: alkaline phosphatase family protein [Bryobacteraceae bacterium]|nr:alkaline phosphatase family protein [Bryobacteraceae bacterium]